LAIVIGFKGKERTTELRLAPNVITKLALEAQFRGLGISELIGALVAATTEKDLFQLILKTDEMSKGPQKLAVTEIRVFEYSLNK
jgi:hypothetical protein